MSFKTILTLLLLSCLGATGTALGVLEEPPQDEGVKKIIVTDFDINEIRLDITATNATLQFCSVGELPPGHPKLIYTVETGDKTVDGSRDLEKLKCANFMMIPSFTLPDVTTKYELVFEENGNVGRCVSTFAMTAKTFLLTCGMKTFTKVTWGDPTPIDYKTCVGMDMALLTEPVCYFEGDIWAEDFCFSIDDDESRTITICLNGLPSLVTEVGAVSANYFYYGTEAVANQAGDATLSLTTSTPNPTNVRAIVRQSDTGIEKVHDCPNSQCTFKDYTRKVNVLEVCTDTMDDNKETQETATTIFTDLYLNAFDGGSQKSSLMEFVFANGLDPMMYSASYSLVEPTAGNLGDAQLTVNVDCTSVSPGKACFGYLDIGANTDPVYLALSDPDGINTIVTSYKIIV